MSHHYRGRSGGGGGGASPLRFTRGRSRSPRHRSRRSASPSPPPSRPSLSSSSGYGGQHSSRQQPQMPYSSSSSMALADFSRPSSSSQRQHQQMGSSNNWESPPPPQNRTRGYEDDYPFPANPTNPSMLRPVNYSPPKNFSFSGGYSPPPPSFQRERSPQLSRDLASIFERSRSPQRIPPASSSFDIDRQSLDQQLEQLMGRRTREMSPRVAMQLQLLQEQEQQQQQKQLHQHPSLQSAAESESDAIDAKWRELERMKRDIDVRMNFLNQDNPGPRRDASPTFDFQGYLQGGRPRSPLHAAAAAAAAAPRSMSISPPRFDLPAQRLVDDRQLRSQSPGRRRSPRRESPRRRSPWRGHSPARENSRRQSPRRVSPRRENSPRRQSPPRRYSPRRDSPRRQSSPPRRFSPRRERSPERRNSPRRQSPRRYSPVRRESPRRFSPRRENAERRPSPPRRRSPPRSKSPPRQSIRQKPRERQQRSPESARRSGPPQSRGAMSDLVTTTTTVWNQTGRIREYVDESCGIIEMPKTHDGSYPSCYFSADAVFVPNPYGNPYGPPVPFSEVSSRGSSSSSASLRDFLPVGVDLQINAAMIEGNKYFKLLATAVWPKTTESPLPGQADGIPMRLLLQHLQDFEDYFEEIDPVPVAVHGLASPRLKPASGKVWEVLSDDYGTIELKLTSKGVRFFALFHREDVYLKDGKHAVEHEFFRDKPLGAMVSVGQPCSLSARSIVHSKGAGLRSSGMELQAIAVSLNPDTIPFSAPRASRLSGGPGTFGLSVEFTPFFFEKALPLRLNRRLVEFLRNSGKRYPDLDQSCLQVDPVVPRRQEQESSARPVLSGEPATVKELLGTHYGVLEGFFGGRQQQRQQHPPQSWKCFFTSSETLLHPGQSMEDTLRPGTVVFVNARLIDPAQQIPYLASLVWTESNLLPSHEVIARRAEANINDQRLMQRYLDVNEVLAFDNGGGGGGSGGAARSREEKSPPAPPNKRQQQLEEYYNVATGSVFRLLDDNFALIQVGETLVLFDVCDFWLDPVRTASKEGKKMDEVVKVGSVVHFHAALLQPEVRIQYLASSVWHKDTPGFSLSNCPKAIRKEDIHKEKVDIYRQVVQSVAETLPSAESMTPIDPRDVSLKKYGAVRLVFVDASATTVGGIIQFDLRKFCFFLAEHCSPAISRQMMRAGLNVCLNVARVGTSNAWSDKVGFVSLSVFDTGETVDEENGHISKTKAAAGIAKMDELVQLLGAVETAKFLSDPSRPASSVVSLPSARQVSQQQMKEIDSCGYFKCLFSPDCNSGLLEDRDRPGRLVYFELSDVNVMGEVPLLDLVSMLNQMPGIEIRYRACVLKESGPIQMVAHDRGVRIVGELQGELRQNVKRTDVAWGAMTPVHLNRDKRQRFREAESKFSAGGTLVWDDLIAGRRQPAGKRGGLMEDASKPPREEILIRESGVIKYILNENFGLVQGPRGQGAYLCLFDTYDLHIGPNAKTAADAELSVAKVVSVGDVVTYNACLVKADAVVPYLATALWKEDGEVRGVEPLARKAVQQDKINIYHQVVQSCSAMLAKKKDPSPTTGTTTAVATGVTGPSSRDLSEVIKDTDTTGTMLEQKCDLFALLELSNGGKALLSNHRVWINKKPKFGGWRPLYLEYFKTLNVNARKVSGYADFQYQVSFCHSGVHNRNWRTKEFDYTSEMIDWISSVATTSSMDAELTLFKSRHGKKMP